jgi:hypothetical protein
MTLLLMSISGLLPIVQWLIALERNPQPTRKLLMIERLQGWSMLAYYPLEHIYYLRSHGIIPATIPSLASLFSSSAKPFTPGLDTIGMWSSRFWALHVILQFAHLSEDYKLLSMRERSLRKAKGTGHGASEKEELQRSWDAYWNEVIVNVGYLPLTIHWYVFQGSSRLSSIPSPLSLFQVAQERTVQERSAFSYGLHLIILISLPRSGLEYLV